MAHVPFLNMEGGLIICTLFLTSGPPCLDSCSLLKLFSTCWSCSLTAWSTLLLRSCSASTSSSSLKTTPLLHWELTEEDGTSASNVSQQDEEREKLLHSFTSSSSASSSCSTPPLLWRASVLCSSLSFCRRTMLLVDTCRDFPRRSEMETHTFILLLLPVACCN